MKFCSVLEFWKNSKTALFDFFCVYFKPFRAVFFTHLLKAEIHWDFAYYQLRESHCDRWDEGSSHHISKFPIRPRRMKQHPEGDKTWHVFLVLLRQAKSHCLHEMCHWSAILHFEKLSLQEETAWSFSVNFRGNKLRASIWMISRMSLTLPLLVWTVLGCLCAFAIVQFCIIEGAGFLSFKFTNCSKGLCSW